MAIPRGIRVPAALLEQTTIFGSLLKWTVLATLVGILTGLSTALFLDVLAKAVAAVEPVPFRLGLLPIGLAAAAVVVRLLAPEAEGHGTERVIEAVHRRWGQIPGHVAPVKLVATVVTIAAGGSVGKEGPCAQIGAALASVLAGALRLRPRDRRKTVICGISAGFATVFGTPIAGSIFGLEVLSLGVVSYDVLYPSFVAGIVGHHVATRLGVTYFHESLWALPTATEGILLKTVMAGVIFGLVARLLIEALRGAEFLVHRLPGPRPVHALGGGVLLGALAWLVSSAYLGLGLQTIEASVRGAWVSSLAFLWKTVFTAVSLATGGSGGIITPIFFVGSTAGSAVGYLLGFDRGTFAAIGMVAVLAGAANTPLSASIMAIELFGSPVGPFAAIACIVSFLVVGHRSVYPSQVVAIAKSASVRVQRGAELRGEVAMEVRLARFRRIRLLARALARRVRRDRRDG